MKRRPSRIYYYAGPGDVVGTYKSWKTGEQYKSEVAITYSELFFRMAKRHSFNVKVQSFSSYSEEYRDKNVAISQKINQPYGNGLRFHFRAVVKTLNQLWTAIVFRADYAIISDTYHWYLWAVAPIFGIRVVPSLHCALWPKDEFPEKKSEKLILALNRLFWKYCAHATIAVSPEIEKQITFLVKPKIARVFPSRPSYKVPAFIQNKNIKTDTIEIMFAGRIIIEKGIIELCDTANILRADTSKSYKFIIYGTGPDEETLKEYICQHKLEDYVEYRGKAKREQMLIAYASADIIFVPTTKDFAEGLNKVTVEGALAGTPVLGSKYTHAKEVLGDAYYEVLNAQASDYADAIRLLSHESDEVLQGRLTAINDIRAICSEESNAWHSAIEKIISM